VLMDQAMESRSLLKVPLVLQGRFRLDRWPGQALYVAQLEASRAVHIVLQAALAELKVGWQRHTVNLQYPFASQFD
jgi:hypothetical protein